MEERWKKIDWLEGLKQDYEISSMGRIRRIGGLHYTFEGTKYIKKVRYLKPHLNTNGYYTVNLFLYGKLKHIYVHILVADAFIKKEDGKEYINHKNMIKTDNRIENLERCTQQYNVNYSKFKICKPAKKYRKNQYGRNIRRHKDGKYEVCCYHNGKGKYIGRFFTIEEARKARNDYLESLGLLQYLTEEEILCKA